MSQVSAFVLSELNYSSPPSSALLFFIQKISASEERLFLKHRLGEKKLFSGKQN